MSDEDSLESHSIVLRDSRALGRPMRALPVLDAFRQFLAAERRRARNRMLGLAGVFILILVALGIAAVGVFDRLAGDFRVVRSEIETVKNESSRVRDNARSVLAKVLEETSSLKEDLAREQLAMTDAGSGMATRLDKYAAELGAVRNLLEALESRDAQAEDEGQGDEAVSPPVPAVVVPERPVEETPSPRYEPLVVSILPRGGSEPILWRLLVPQTE